MAEQETHTYMDIDVFGRENSDGTPRYHLDEDAIKNSLTQWLSSKKGDFIRQPNKGGIIDKLLFREMNDRNATLMAFQIQNAIANEFVPEIRLVDLAITPNFEQRMWEIEIKFENPLSKKIEALVIYTKDLSAKESLDFIPVEYVGNNLYNFCDTKKVSMGNELIVYDSETEFFIWGQYQLTNFSIDDPRYDDILELINGN